MTLVDWLLLAAVAAAIAGAVLLMRRSKTKGHGCCGNCSQCSGGCQNKK